jgi:hypothetical protein
MRASSTTNLSEYSVRDGQPSSRRKLLYLTKGFAATAAGQNQASIQKGVASQEVKDGNITLHLPDGSSMTLIGITDVDASFMTWGAATCFRAGDPVESAPTS